MDRHEALQLFLGNEYVSSDENVSIVREDADDFLVGFEYDQYPRATGAVYFVSKQGFVHCEHVMDSWDKIDAMIEIPVEEWERVRQPVTRVAA